MHEVELESVDYREGRAVVLGRRELSVVLLIFGAIFCVYVVLLAGPIAAQSGGGSTGGSTGQTSGNQNNQNVVIQGQSNNVITNTIPNKPLPPTGGWPVKALVAGFILSGAGLLGLRLGIWHGRR